MAPFPGIRPYVVGKLFGTSAAAQALETYDSGSIIHNLVNGIALSPEQAKFLSSSRMPAARLLLESNFSGSSVRNMAFHLVDPISYDITVQFGRALISTIRAAALARGTPSTDLAGSAPLSIPKFVVDNIDSAERELNVMATIADQSVVAIGQIAAAQKDMRALFGLTGRGTWNGRLARAGK
jgi:hypothetical protein